VNPAGARAERRVRWYYRMRGYRVLAANERAGGNELDIVLRRGRLLVFCEVKARSSTSFADPLESIDAEKLRRIRRAAEAFLARRPDLAGLDIALEAVAVRAGGIDRVRAG